MLLSGLICQSITQPKLLFIGFAKSLCEGENHAGLSILVQVDSSLKKYVGLVHRWDN